MVEKESRNDIQEKKDRLSRKGWVEIQDGREEGRFLKYGEIDAKSNIIHGFYSGNSTKGDQFGRFLVWNCKVFDSQIKTGNDREIKIASEELKKEGWMARMGVVTEITLGNAGEEIGQNVLVAIKRKDESALDFPKPSDTKSEEVKGVLPAAKR